MPRGLGPNRHRGLDDQAELGDLVRLAERVAGDGAGEAALRAEAKLFQRQVFRRFVDPAVESGADAARNWMATTSSTCSP